MKDKDFARNELIGLEVKVSESKNRYSKGIEGKVIDETRNIIIVARKDGTRKSLIKAQNTFQFSIGKKIIEIEGKQLVGRPEDRIKKRD